MDDIVITFETLFEMLRLERSRTELQNLPEDFTQESRNFISNERDETNRLEGDAQDKRETQIKNTLKIINEIYERRERKIVNMALDKSKTASAIIDFSKFLENEESMFNEILDILNRYRRDVIDGQKAEEKKEVKEEPTMPTAKETQGKEKIIEEKEELKNDNIQDRKTKTVRFLSPMPMFVGLDLEEYGPFDEEEITNLPGVIADLLVKKERAQEIQPI